MTFTPESFTGYRFLSNPRVAPGGAYVLYQVARAELDENRYESRVFLWDVEKDTGLQLTGSGKDRGALWEDEHTVLFSSGRDASENRPPETQYWRIRIDGGEAEKAFCIPLAVQDIHPLGDDEWLLIATHDPAWDDVPEEKDALAAYMKEKEKEKKWEVLDELPYWFNGQGYTGNKRSVLYRYRASDGELTPLTPRNEEVEGVVVHPDRTRAAFSFNKKETVMELDSGLAQIDLATGEITRYDCVPAGSVFPLGYAGEDLFFAATDRQNHGLNEDPHIWLMQKDGGFRQITKDSFELSLGSSVNSDLRHGGGYQARTDGESLYLIVTSGARSELIRMEKDGTHETLLTDAASVDSFDVKDGKIYSVLMRDLSAQELYADDRRLTSHNQEMPEPVPVETFAFESRGRTLRGFVLAPKNRSERTPAILSIHGGPKTVFGEALHHEMQLLAENGFYVFYTNPHGSDGFGRDFMDIRGQYGTKDYEDLMALTDAFLEAYPDADPERLGVMGGSYGGWMTNWIISHTDRFRAACSQRSISNWISFFGNSDIGYYFTPDQVGADPWTDPKRLWDNSPLQYADQVRTPTLFIHSDEDYRCWLPEGLQMYSALKYHGIPSRMVVFHNENHELSRGGKPQARVRRLEEIITWFTKYLTE